MALHYSKIVDSRMRVDWMNNTTTTTGKEREREKRCVVVEKRPKQKRGRERRKKQKKSQRYAKTQNEGVKLGRMGEDRPEIFQRSGWRWVEWAWAWA